MRHMRRIGRTLKEAFKSVGNFMYRVVYMVFGTDGDIGGRVVHFDTDRLERSVEYHNPLHLDAHKGQIDATKEFIRKIVCSILLFVPAVVIIVLGFSLLLFLGIAGHAANYVAECVIYVAIRTISYMNDRKLKSFIREHG